MKKTKILTEMEAQIMNVLWNKGECSVNDVLENLGGKQAYTTIATMLNILEKKGYLKHYLKGRTYVYYAVKNQNDVSHSILQHIIHLFYRGSSVHLVAQLVKSGQLSEDNLDDLKKIIEKAEQNLKKEDSHECS